MPWAWSTEMVGKELDSYFQVFPMCETAARFDHRETLHQRAAGKFRSSADQLLVNDGSSISFETMPMRSVMSLRSSPMSMSGLASAIDAGALRRLAAPLQRVSGNNNPAHALVTGERESSSGAGGYVRHNSRHTPGRGSRKPIPRIASLSAQPR